MILPEAIAAGPHIGVALAFLAARLLLCKKSLKIYKKHNNLWKTLKIHTFPHSIVCV